jgi:hypothetical protein
MTRNTLHTKLFHTNELLALDPTLRSICRGIGSSTIPGLDVKLLNRIRQLRVVSTISTRFQLGARNGFPCEIWGSEKRDSDDMRHNAVYCVFLPSLKTQPQFQMEGNQLPSKRMKFALHCHARDPGPVLTCRSNTLYVRRFNFGETRET